MLERDTSRVSNVHLEGAPHSYKKGPITPLVGVKITPVTHLQGYSQGYNSIYKDCKVHLVESTISGV